MTALVPPLAGIPLLIASAAAGIPVPVPVFFAFPFAAGAWIGLSFWRGREPKRRVWFYAFTEGFMLLDRPPVARLPMIMGRSARLSLTTTHDHECGPGGVGSGWRCS